MIPSESLSCISYLQCHASPPRSIIFAVFDDIVAVGFWIGSFVLKVTVISCPTVASVVSEKFDLYETYVMEGDVSSIVNSVVLSAPIVSFPGTS